MQCSPSQCSDSFITDTMFYFLESQAFLQPSFKSSELSESRWRTRSQNKSQIHRQMDSLLAQYLNSILSNIKMKSYILTIVLGSFLFLRTNCYRLDNFVNSSIWLIVFGSQDAGAISAFLTTEQRIIENFMTRKGAYSCKLWASTLPKPPQPGCYYPQNFFPQGKGNDKALKNELNLKQLTKTTINWVKFPTTRQT